MLLAAANSDLLLLAPRLSPALGSSRVPGVGISALSFDGL